LRDNEKYDAAVQDVRKPLLAIMDRYKLDLVRARRDYNRVRKATGVKFTEF
jgi:hypothetical protein